jgi:hypothetical protein
MYDNRMVKKILKSKSGGGRKEEDLDWGGWRV